jgi:uncharacterized alpha-E superfamily protein
VLSRIAESLYWMSRYLERADNTARMLQINLLYFIEAEDALSEEAQWKPLLSITGGEEPYAECYGVPDITAHKVIRFMTQERTNPNCIRSVLRMARENARVVRDRISKEMWGAMNELWLAVDAHLQTPLPSERAAAFYALVRDEVARFHGVTLNTMMRGREFSFYTLGTFVERVDMTARLMDVKYHLLFPNVSMVGSPLDYYHWAALLKSLSGFEAYRRKYHLGPRPLDIAQFIIFDPDFPRSLRFAVDGMANALKKINDDGLAQLSCDALGHLMEHLDKNTPETVFAQGRHEFLEELLERVSVLNAALAADYFEARLEETLCVI